MVKTKKTSMDELTPKQEDDLLESDLETWREQRMDEQIRENLRLDMREESYN